ncbi:hypothetical protein [Mycobacterium uberis]|uniref:hypothetical protein n=1 Tax=Mycobacterium uberis TaxID=2162698 RepID=UPI001FB1DE66|nr:hypothetical protein [Mycobacterium uberis]
MLSWYDVLEPTSRPSQVLVNVQPCGIYSTEMHFADILMLAEWIARDSGSMHVDLSRDVFMGHESSAEVLEAETDTENYLPKTGVTSIPALLSANGIKPNSLEE